MKRTTLILTATAALAVTGLVSAAEPPRMKMTTEIPAGIITPDTIETRLGDLNVCLA
jgi:hypothetical protein